MSAPNHVPAEVNAAAAIARSASGESWLLDVREPHEWAAGHAPEAHHVPMGALQQRLGELPGDEHILVICHTGGRSARVTAALLGAGYSASNVVGGMESWRSAGGAVETPGGGAGTVI